MGQRETSTRLCVIVVMTIISGLSALPRFDNDGMHPTNFAGKSNIFQEGKRVEDAAYWRTSALEALSRKLKDERIIGQAKNVIMFLGDGWDTQTMTAARILKGQDVDIVQFGEEAKLHMESFSSTGFSKTYCTDSQVADSACSATAYLCGVKANSGTIGVTSDVLRGNCTAQQNVNNHVKSILALAQAAGKSTGVVTTTRITHASPSGTYAHTANRDWECDKDVVNSRQDPDSCDDIAEQLILLDPGKNVDVILGGGRRKFIPDSQQDSEGSTGDRTDGKNLIETWKLQKTENGLNATYVEKLEELRNVDAQKTDALFGLFSSDHIAYYHEQAENDDPSLTEMTEKAIEILQKNPNGFFLFVEGGRIDHAHHATEGLRSLWETVEFDRAIKKGDEMTNDEDTLIVVTADHGHTMSFAGYAARGSRITGIAGYGEDYDNLPYSTINYASGPGFKPFVGEMRYNISKDDLESLTTKQVPLVPQGSETHGGDDVPIVAKGPFSHLLTGIHEQNYIPYVMAYASCVGEGPTFCEEK
jgi:alkaline phosphatase